MHFKEVINRLDSSEMAFSVGFEIFLLFLYVYRHTHACLCVFVYGQEAVGDHLCFLQREGVYFS